MKISMHWDTEGVSRPFTRDQVWYREEAVRKEVAEQGRDLRIADINSAVAAALEAGVDEIIVSDTRHGGGNIVLEQMLRDPRVTCNRKVRDYRKGEYRWMPGLDERVVGLMVPAQHAKAGSQGVLLPDTQSGEWEDFRINGQSLGEMGIEACFAAHWDEAVPKGAEEQFPWIVTAAVKGALNPDHCTGPEPEGAHNLVAERIAEAIETLCAEKCKPFKAELSNPFIICMKRAEHAETAARSPTVEHVDESSIRGYAEQHCAVLEWLMGTDLKMPEPK